MGGQGRAKGSSYSYSSACVGCVPFGCWRARIRVAEWEGGRGPRSRGASEVGADHVEVEAVVVGGGDRCPPRRERSHGRVSGRAEKNAPPTLRIATTSVRVVGTSFLHCCNCHRVQLCHNRRAPRKSRPRAATSLTAGRQSAWVQSSSSSSSWDGVGRFFLRVSKLFGSQPR